MEDLDYDIYSGWAWLSQFADTLMPWEKESVRPDDVIIRIMDLDGHQTGLRHISSEDWREMTRAMHPDIIEDDLEELVRWFNKATITIQVKGLTAVSDAENVNSDSVPGVISLMETDGTHSHTFSISTTGASGDRGRSSGGLPPGLTQPSGGGGSGGDGGDGGESAIINCPVCHLPIQATQIGAHLQAHIPQLSQMQVSPTQGQEPPPSYHSSGLTRLSAGDRRQRKRQFEAQTTARVEVSANSMSTSGLASSMAESATTAAFNGAVSILERLNQDQWQVFSIYLGQFLGGTEWFGPFRDYLQMAVRPARQALVEMNQNMQGKTHPELGVINAATANKLMLSAIVKAAQKWKEKGDGRKVIARKLQTQAGNYQVAINEQAPDERALLHDCATLMGLGFFDSMDIGNTRLNSPLRQILEELTYGIMDEGRAMEARQRVTDWQGESIDRQGTLRDLDRLYKKITRGEGDLLYNLMSREFHQGLVEENMAEPELQRQISHALGRLWETADEDLKENLAYLAIFLLEDNFLGGGATAASASLATAASVVPVASGVGILQSRPSVKQITGQDAMKQLSKSEHYRILFHLGLSVSDLDDLNQQHRDAKIFQMHGYTRWLAENSDATWQQLIDQLTQQNKNRHAKELRESLLQSATGASSPSPLHLDTVLKPDDLKSFFGDVRAASTSSVNLLLWLLPSYEVSILEKDCRQCDTLLLKGLQIWLETAQNPTLRAVVNALSSESIREFALAKKIKQKYTRH